MSHATRSILICLTALVVYFPCTVHAQNLGVSWKDQGLRALGTGNLDSAQFYYEHWLKADPQDESSWYNLACIYALQGSKEQAIDAWEKSVEAGWNDPEHPLNDSDLESIRSDARFTAALEKVSQSIEEKGPKGYIRNFLETRSVGTYIVALPEDYETSNRNYPLCVILHGSGSSETGHGQLADAFGRDGVIYISPRAPYTHTSSYKGTGELGFTAWTPDQIDSLDPMYKAVPQLYAAWIMECIRDAQAHYRVNNQKPILLGHSQGAAFSWITASLYPNQIRSIFAYAGYFPDDFCTDEKLRGVKNANVKITLAHGTADNVVAPEATTGIAALLKEQGIAYSFTEHEGVGHGIAKDVMEQMKEWIDSETGRTRKE